jgi:hypothetical protein
MLPESFRAFSADYQSLIISGYPIRAIRVIRVISSSASFALLVSIDVHSWLRTEIPIHCRGRRRAEGQLLITRISQVVGQNVQN